MCLSATLPQFIDRFSVNPTLQTRAHIFLYKRQKFLPIVFSLALHLELKKKIAITGGLLILTLLLVLGFGFGIGAGLLRKGALVVNQYDIII